MKYLKWTILFFVFACEDQAEDEVAWHLHTLAPTELDTVLVESNVIGLQVRQEINLHASAIGMGSVRVEDHGFALYDLTLDSLISSGVVQNDDISSRLIVSLGTTGVPSHYDTIIGVAIAHTYDIIAYVTNGDSIYLGNNVLYRRPPIVNATVDTINN